MRSGTIALAAVVVLRGVTASAAPGEPTPGDAARMVEELSAAAGRYADVPEDPVLYGYAARMKRLQKKAKLHGDTAAGLGRYEAGSGGSDDAKAKVRMAAFEAMERGEAAATKAELEKLEKEAKAKGISIPDVDRVIEAITIRLVAEEARRVLEAHRAGKATDEELMSVSMMGFALADTHGQDMLEKEVLDRWAPEELRELP